MATTPEIDPADVRVETYRPPGQGAWSVRPESGIRLFHVPTRITVECHTSASAHGNRALAWAELTRRLAGHQSRPAAKTTAERQQEFRQRQIAAGFKEIRNLWAHPDDHEAIKTYAGKLTRRRQKAPPDTQ